VCGAKILQKIWQKIENVVNNMTTCCMTYFLQQYWRKESGGMAELAKASVIHGRHLGSKLGIDRK
jgi:hypothetical protein